MHAHSRPRRCVQMDCMWTDRETTHPLFLPHHACFLIKPIDAGCRNKDPSSTMALFQHDPEAAYRWFVERCNRIGDSLFDVMTSAQQLAGNSDESVHIRKVLLSAPSEHNPSWEDLYRARLSFDLDNPEMFLISPVTKFVSILLQVYHPDDVTSAASKHVISRKDKRGSVEAFLTNDVYRVCAHLLDTDIREYAIGLTFTQYSICHLYKIDPTSTSMQIVRNKIRKMSFLDRKSIAQNIADYARRNKKTTITSNFVKRFHEFDQAKEDYDFESEDSQVFSDTEENDWGEEVTISDLDRDSEKEVMIYQRVGSDQRRRHAQDDFGCCNDKHAKRLCSNRSPVSSPYRDETTTIANTSRASRAYLPVAVHHDRRFAIDMEHYWNSSVANASKYLDDVALGLDSLVMGNRANREEEYCRRNESGQLDWFSLQLASEKPAPLVMRICDAFSPSFRSRLFADLDRSRFMKGVGGRENSFIRVARRRENSKEEEGTYFQIGRKLYPSDESTDTENQLMDQINSLLRVQHAHSRMISHNEHGVFPSTYQTINTLQIMVEYVTKSSGYARHNDCGKLLNSTGSIDTARVTDIDTPSRLPYAEETQTVTAVFVCGVAGMKDVATHNLNFFDSDGKQISSCPTTENMIHFQMHGTQLYQHEVSCKNADVPPGCYRIVISCRHTRIKSDSSLSLAFGDSYRTMMLSHDSYNLIRVLTSMASLTAPTFQYTHGSVQNRNGEGVNEETALPYRESADNGETTFRDDLTIEASKFSDHFPKPSPEDYELCDVYRSTDLWYAYPGEDWKFFFRHNVVRHLVIEHGVVPCVDYSGKAGTSLTHPSLFCLPESDRLQMIRPLTRIPLSAVVSAGGLSHSHRAHPPTCGDPDRTNIIILSKPYKNDTQSIIDAVSAHCKRRDSSNLLHPIYVYGSGGSPRKTDTYTCDITKMSSSDPSNLTSHSQLAKHVQNTTMIQLTERKGVVAVFLNMKEFAPFLKGIVPKQETEKEEEEEYEDFENANDAMFLGYYYFSSYHYSSLSDKEFWESRECREDLWRCLSSADRKTYANLSRFVEESHFKFQLDPIFPSVHELNRAHDEFGASGLTYSRLSLGSKMGIRVAVSRGDEVDRNETQPCVINNDPCLSDFTDRFLSGADLARHLSRISGSEHNSEIESTLIMTKSKKLPHLLVDDIIQHAIMMMTCGSKRYLRKNLRGCETSSDQTCGPLLPDERLQSIYRCHPFPMPLRTYDVMSLFLRACALDLMILPIEQYLCARGDVSMFDKEILFMAILNRITGRPNVYCQYRAHFPELIASYLPSSSEINEFIDFVEQNNVLAKLFNPQHSDSIPRDFRCHAHVFRETLEKLANSCQTIFDILSRANSRSQCLEALSAHLFDLFESTKTMTTERGRCPAKARFLAHHVLCDLEEIFDSPFGDVLTESVVAGHGGSQGISVCNRGLRTENIDRQATISIEEITSLLRCRLTEPSTRAGMYRRMLGLQISEKGHLVIALNGREFNHADTEHIMCKVYIGISKTISTRATSRYPECSKPGFHPVKLVDCDIPWDDDHVQQIMRDVDECYDAALSMRDFFTHTHDLFKLCGEPDVFNAGDDN